MDTDFEVPYPIRVAVVGLQAFTIIALVSISLAVLVAMFWKNILLQNFVQLVAKVLPIDFILNSSRFQRTMINAKIDTEHCAICYCDIDKEVKSNCGHVFCGDCLIKVWYSKKHEKISCPLCRCDVNVIVPSFAHQQPDQDDSHEEIINSINKYNISCSNCPSTILGLILGSPSSMKIFLESLPARKGFARTVKVFLAFLYSLAMLVYLVSPSEMAHEHDNMFGLIDESASFIYLFLYVILIFIFMS